MTDEVIFYHNPRSRSSMAAWMLEEVGAPYRVVDMPWETQATRQPEFLAVNPMGKIPTIQHRGVTVTETAAVIAYLADAFPEAGLAPATTSPERGAYYRWLFFAAGCVEPAMLDVMTKRPQPESKIAAGYGSYDDVLGTLRGLLSSRDYVATDSFSAADLYVASELNFMGMFGAPNVKGDPVLDAYVARCTARPAYERAMRPSMDAVVAQATAAQAAKPAP